jgi:hypothetical protein
MLLYVIDIKELLHSGINYKFGSIFSSTSKNLFLRWVTEKLIFLAPARYTFIVMDRKKKIELCLVFYKPSFFLYTAAAADSCLCFI